VKPEGRHLIGKVRFTVEIRGHCKMKRQICRKANQTLFYGILLLIALIPLFCLGIANHGLWTADEPRVAEIGREMALTGNWTVPALNQKPFLEQPPLYYASIALTFRACKVISDKVARIPAVMFSLGGCIALFFLGCFLFNPRIAFFSGLILATSFEYFRVAHWLVVDSALTCFIIAAMVLFIKGYLSENSKKKILFYILFYISSVCAFLTKGFIGLAIPVLAIFVFLIYERNVKELLKMRLWLGICIFIVMTLPWFIGLWQQGGSEYLNIFLVHNHLERFLPGGSSGHHQPFYFYLTGFPEGFLPWAILLAPVLYFSFRKCKDLSAPQKTGILFLKCWFFMGIIFLSTASTKRILYLLPIFAPFAMLTANYIDSTLLPRMLIKLEKVFLYVFGFLPLLIGLIIIPAYFLASRKYSLISSHYLIFMLITASVLITGFSLLSLLYLYRKRMSCFWIWSSGAFYIVLIFALITVMPILDQFKSFVPFCEQVKTIVKPGSPLFAYNPDETLRGFIPFYTGYYLKETDSKEYLEKIARKGDQIFVVIRDNKGSLENELLSSGKFSIVTRQGEKTDRSLVLLTNKK
jgi:4-amino-4-deoxy-L-arabinose transferase-like glycosyltransferase